MLRKIIGVVLVSISVFAFAGVSFAGNNPGVVQQDYKYIMPLSQVKPGMKGYGLTVFKGTKIEKFNVTVVSLMRKVNNGKDLILVKMSGGPVTERQANIMHGMSGSPVYVNGKIIGAVAYGPAKFAKEPLGMLTPIEDMLDSLDPKLPSKPLGIAEAVTADLDSPVESSGKIINRITIQDPDSNAKAESGSFTMVPLMTPLMVSGISQRGVSQLAGVLKPFGIIPMAGPSAKAENVPVNMVPGAGVGLSLATGDIDMTAVGTLTYRRGNKIVGFGHPMMSLGPIDAPMTTVYIHDCFPSYEDSTKLGAGMKVVGRIFQDRPWSIGGEIGKFAKLVPVTVNVSNGVNGRNKTFRIGVINHPLLISKLISTVVGEAVAQVHGLPGEAMAKIKVNVDADGLGTITRDNVFFDGGAIETSATADLTDIVSILRTNKFSPVDIKSVTVNAQIMGGRKTATVERIFVDKSKFEPGETVNVGVELKPYKAEKIVKTVKIRIPEDAPDGRLNLTIAGGLSEGTPANPLMALFGGSTPPNAMKTGNPQSVKQMIDRYLKQPKNDELVAKMTLPVSAVNISGQKMSDLPDAIAMVMKSTRTSSVKVEAEEIKVTEPCGYIIDGGQSLSISVGRRRYSEKPGPAPSVEAPSAQEMPSPPSSSPASIDMEEDFGDSPFQTQPGNQGSEFGMAVGRGPSEPSSELKVEQTKPEVVKPEDADKPGADDAGKDTPADMPKSESPKMAEKTVVRQPSTWKQKSYQEFSLGSFSGTAASTSDDVRVASSIDKLSSLPETYVWKVIPDGKGGVFAGTGNRGIIYRVSRDGKATEFFKTEELEVHSLAMGQDGSLYAGTSPNGKVFKITPDGKGATVLEATEKYILALAADNKGNVYAGTGDAGVIYKISGGKSAKFASVHENSIMALAVDKFGTVYAGTAKDGVVYKITPDGKVSALYNASEDSVASVAVDSAGNVYAGTGSGKGNIYKIPADGSAVKTVFEKAPKALSMAVDAEDNVYAVSDDQIVKITKDESAMLLDTKRAGVQFISVAVDKDGTVVAGTANSAAVYTSAGTESGTYESPVHDAGLNATWGAVNWIAETPAGTSVKVETRTGNVSEPDASWSSWLKAEPGSTSNSPVGRYAQYRATLTGSKSASPALKQVSIAYMTRNRAPKVTISDPQPGAVIARSATVKWSGSDLDKDALTYDLFYSSDSGKTWQPLGSGLKSDTNGAKPADAPKPGAEPAKTEPAKQPEAVKPPSAQDLMAQLKTELDSHPEIPQQIKDKMIAEAPAAIDKAVEAASKPAEAPTATEAQSGTAGASMKQTSYNWDTTKVPDGTYMIKVVASDRTSNAVGYLKGEKIVSQIVISNKVPKVVPFTKDLKVNSDSTVSVEGYTISDLTPIAGVQFKVDKGDWMSAAAKDGIFDTKSESFAVTTQTLSKGKHSIEIKAVDAAGNAASATVDAEVK